MLVGLFIISIRPKYGELRGVVKEGYCVLHSLTDLFYRWTVTWESSPVHRGLHRINSEDTLAGTSVCTDPSQHPDQYIPSQKLPDSATILRLLAYMQSHIKNSFLRVLISQFKESTIFSILCFKRNIDFFLHKEPCTLLPILFLFLQLSCNEIVAGIDFKRMCCNMSGSFPRPNKWQSFLGQGQKAYFSNYLKNFLKTKTSFNHIFKPKINFICTDSWGINCIRWTMNKKEMKN